MYTKKAEFYKPLTAGCCLLLSLLEKPLGPFLGITVADINKYPIDQILHLILSAEILDDCFDIRVLTIAY
jgi:hypothetical protein